MSAKFFERPINMYWFGLNFNNIKEDDMMFENYKIKSLSIKKVSMKVFENMADYIGELFDADSYFNHNDTGKLESITFINSSNEIVLYPTKLADIILKKSLDKTWKEFTDEKLFKVVKDFNLIEEIKFEKDPNSNKFFD